MLKVDESVENIMPGVTETLPYEFVKIGLMNKIGKWGGRNTSQKIKQVSRG
jgi:hypothetical protein